MNDETSESAIPDRPPAATVTGIECSDARPRDVGLRLRLPEGVTVKKGDLLIKPVERAMKLSDLLCDLAASRRIEPEPEFTNNDARSEYYRVVEFLKNHVAAHGLTPVRNHKLEGSWWTAVEVAEKLTAQGLYASTRLRGDRAALDIDFVAPAVENPVATDDVRELVALCEKVNKGQHTRRGVSTDEWSELWQLTHKIKAQLRKADRPGAEEKRELYLLADDELATILAALRYWQERGLADDPQLRSDWLHEVATNGGDLTSLCGEEVDQLCERLNAVGLSLTDEPAVTKHVTTVTVADPDSGLPVELEVRKCLDSNALVGIDASYLEQDAGEVYNPYNPGRLLIPDTIDES